MNTKKNICLLTFFVVINIIYDFPSYAAEAGLAESFAQLTVDDNADAQLKKVLAEKNINVDKQSGNSALMDAASRLDYGSFTKLLQEGGIDVSQRNKEGLTALSLVLDKFGEKKPPMYMYDEGQRKVVGKMVIELIDVGSCLFGPPKDPMRYWHVLLYLVISDDKYGIKSELTNYINILRSNYRKKYQKAHINRDYLSMLFRLEAVDEVVKKIWESKLVCALNQAYKLTKHLKELENFKIHFLCPHVDFSK